MIKKDKLFRFLSFIIISLVLITVTSCSDDNKKTPEQEYDIYKVNVKSSLNVRQSASSRSKILVKLKNESLVEVIETEGDWAKIKLPAPYEEGYVSAKYITAYQLKPVIPEPEPEPDLIAPQDLADNRKFTENTKIAESKNAVTTSPLAQDAAPSSNSPEDINEESEVKDGEKIPKAYFSIVRLDSVAPDKVTSIAAELNDSIKSSDPKWKKSWWQSVIDNFRNVDEHYTLVYVKCYGLLTVGGSGGAQKVIQNMRPKDYFDTQVLAQQDAEAGIAKMIETYREAKNYYNETSTFTRTHLGASSPFEFIADDFVLQNILPNDSFWHKFIFGWFFYIPLHFAMFMVNLTGGWISAIILLSLCCMGCKWGQVKLALTYSRTEQTLSILSAVAFRVLNFLCILSIISMIVYVSPDLANIIALEGDKISSVTLQNIFNQYNSLVIDRNWILIIMYIVGGATLIFTPDAELISVSSLSSRVQHSFLKNRNFVELVKQQYKLSDIEFQELCKDEKPFWALWTKEINADPSEDGKKLAVLFCSAFVFNPVFILFTMIFIWTMIGVKAVQVAITMLSYRKQGYYKWA